MMSPGGARAALLEGAENEVPRAAARAKPWIERLGRAGLTAKGVVYVTVGFLAVQAAVGAGGRATDATGALQTLLRQPSGQFLLGLVAAGLFGYALWRLAEAFLNPMRDKPEAKSIAKRIGYAVNGLAYGVLGVAAVAMLIDGGRSSEGGRGAEDWTAWLMSQPFGQWLVGIAGLVFIGFALNALYLAYSAKFRSKLKTAEMSAGEEKVATLAGRIGFAARGTVLGLIGFFLVQAALHSAPGEARGLGGALKTLSLQPHGPWLLGLVAAGLIAYGGHMFVAARYRRIMA